MITCKVCNNQEFKGVLFCSECGSQLAFLSGKKVDTLVYPSQVKGMAIDIKQTIPKKLLETRNLILYYPEGEQVLNLPDQNEFSLGRHVDGQVITPDVDLNPCGAFDKGVSRLHATIRIDPEKDRIFVIDLGSANGTSVNGYEIPAHSEVPLNHEDLLSLGKVHLQVILPKEV